MRSPWFNDNVQEAVLNSTLFRFEIKLPSCGVVTIDMTHDIEIDYEHLEQLLETIPAQYVFWSTLYSEVRAQVSILELKMARRKSFLARSAVERFKLTGGKLTDKQTQAFIESDTVDESAIRQRLTAQNTSKEESLDADALEAQIRAAIQAETQVTLPYLELQHLAAQKNSGKLYHMVQAIQMRSEHCRSLAGFKRQDKEQSGQMT